MALAGAAIAFGGVFATLAWKNFVVSKGEQVCKGSGGRRGGRGGVCARQAGLRRPVLAAAMPA